MGDSRLGTIFVELDLDYSKFEKGQKAILNKATQTSLRVEQNWKTLGAKSDVIYQAMANGAINAYNMIANRATTSAAEQFRAQSAMVAKVNALNMQMANNPLYKTLGVRSVAAIEAQKAAVLSSYNTIKKSGTATAQDLVNIERAKNAKLKALNKEMVGDHEMSMASMTRAVLRFYAAYYVISNVARVVAGAFMSGVKAIDELKISAVSVAAQITSMQGTTGDVLQNYKDNLAYAEALIPVLMRIDASSFANLQQILRMNMAMTNQGVILDTNNKKQLESFTALTNAIALFTIGQNKEKQATQEMRALMSGDMLPGALVAKSMDALIKQEGIYKGGLKEIVKLGREHNDTLERMQPYLIGIVAAGGDIQQTWESVSSSLETSWTILQKELFKDFYKELVGGGLRAAAYVKEHTKLIGDYIKDMATGVVMSLELVGGAFVALRLTGVRTAIALKTSFSAMIFFLEGWTFGTWLNSFKEVRLAAIATIDYLMRGWIHFRAAIKLIWLNMTGDWDVNLNNMEAKFADWLWSVGQGLEKTKLFKSAGESIKAYSLTLADATSHSAEFLEKEKNINDEKEKSLDINKRTIAGLKAEAKVMNDIVKTPTIPIGGDADGEASKAADRIAKTIAELKWQLSIIHETTAAQKALNAVRAAGTTIDTKAGKEIYNLTIKLYEENKAITELKKLREELAEPFTFTFADEGLSQITNMIQGVENLTGAWEEQSARLKIAGDDTELIAQINNDATQKQLAGYSNLFGVMSNFYDEGSKERKNLHALEMAFGAAEIALELEKMIPKAVNAVLSAAEAPWPIGFASAAAMTALVGGLLSIAGVGFGGSSGGASIDRTTAGTVLGSDESSKSLDNTIELLETFRDANVAELENIYQEMQDLNTNISGLANSIVRNISDLTGATVDESTAYKIAFGGYEAMGDLFGWIPVFGDVIEKAFDFVGRLAGDIGAVVYGGRQRVTAEGIAVMGSSVSDILARQAVDARSYYTVKRSGGLTGSTHRSGPRYNELDEGTADLFNKLYVGISESLVTLSEQLGFSVQAALDYSFSEVHINLKNLSAEEIQTKLSAWISTSMDTATDELFGDFLRKYQKIDEGLMETAYRLITTKEVLLSVFEDTGQGFKLAEATISESFTGMGGLIETLLSSVVPNLTDTTKSAAEIMFDFTQSISDSFGGLEEAYDAITNYADKFLTDDEKQQNVTRKMGDIFNMDNLADLNLTLPETREGFKELIKSLDITTESGLAAYTTLINMADIADSYYGTLEENAEKAQVVTETIASMSNELSAFIQFGADGFLSGVERAIMDVEEQGNSYYNELIDNGMAIDEATQKTNEWTTAMFEFVKQEMIDNATRSLTIELLQAQGKEEESLAMQREDTIKGLKDEFGDLAGPMIGLQEEIWRLGDAAVIVEDTLDSLVETMSSFAIQSKVASIAGLTDKFEMEQVGLELGWFENGAPSVAGIRELVGSVLSSSTTEIREQAASFGLSTIDYLENIDFLNTGLTEMDAAIADVASSSSDASDSLRDYADSLQDQISAVESIQDLLNNIRGEGDLAPVQSMEFFENRYQQLLTEAQSGGEREVGVFTDFARKYLEFAGIYGGDYASVTGMVETDLEALQTSIAGDKTLADLYAQLEGVNERLDAVNQNTYATATGIGDAIGKSIVTLLEGFQDATLPWEDWMAETHQDFYGIMESFKSLVGTAMQDMGAGFEFGEGWLGEGSGIDVTQNMVTGAYNATVYGEGGEKLYNLIFDNIESITSSLLWNMMQNTPEVMEKWATAPQHTLPGFASGGIHSGGFRFVGEDGPELEFTGPSRITNTNDSIKIITDAVKGATGNIGGGQNISGSQNITVVVKMGTRQFNDFTVDVLENDPEAHRQIRRVANG